MAWGRFDDRFVASLAQRLQGLRTLEVFGGNGLLAARLSALGARILCTSLFSGHDGHERGLHWPVQELSAVEAVLSHGAGTDALLMSWPVADEAAADAAVLWGTERPIFFIGEVTDPAKGVAGLGGCASDRFFAITEVVCTLADYSPRSPLEKALELRVSAEKASVVRRGFAFDLPSSR